MKEEALKNVDNWRDPELLDKPLPASSRPQIPAPNSPVSEIFTEDRMRDFTALDRKRIEEEIRMLKQETIHLRDKVKKLQQEKDIDDALVENKIK